MTSTNSNRESAGVNAGASSRKKLGPPYYFHPMEWLVGVVVLLLLTYLRTHHFTYGSWLHTFNDGDIDFFAYDTTETAVENTVRNVCAMDITVLCMKGTIEPAHGACEPYFWMLQSESYTSHGNLNRARYALYVKEKSTSSQSEFEACKLHNQIQEWGRNIEFRSTDGKHVRSPLLSKVLASSDGSHVDQDGKNDDLAVMMALLMDIAPRYAPYYPYYSNDEQETILEYFLDEIIIDFFSPSQPAPNERGNASQLDGKDDPDVSTIESSKASRMGVTDYVWSRNELLELAIVVSKHLITLREGFQVIDGRISPFPHISSELVERVVHKMIVGELPDNKKMDSNRQTRSLRSTIMPQTLPTGSQKMVMADQSRLSPHRVANQYGAAKVDSSKSRALEDETNQQLRTKHAFSIFRHNPLIDQCMLSHFDDGTLVTNVCQQAIRAATAKLYEIEVFSPVPTGFIIISQYLFLAVNLVSLLMLGFQFSLRDRVVRKMDRMKKQLEQELTDPFLRQSLEWKAQTLPPTERDQLIAKLESKVQSWDSSERASIQTRIKVIRFRHVTLLVVALTAVVGAFLSIFHIESRARFLESLLVSVGIFTLSYAIPIERTDRNIRGSTTRPIMQLWESLVAAIRGSVGTVDHHGRVSTQPPSSSSFSDTQALLIDKDPAVSEDGGEVVEMRTM